MAVDLGEAFYDEKMWKLGKMPFSLRGLRELQKLFSIKKVVAVDLDNTLWKGVVGEDGVGGVDPDIGLQKSLLDLRRRGILLVALSKNNSEDVAPVWDDRRMLLSRYDFAAAAVDWNDKPDNLRRIAAELNLGTDSFVFVDDSPAERAQMRAALPDVAVADFPPQLEAFFPFAGMTPEDGDKTERYHAEACRRDFAACTDSVEEYLKGLEIRVDVHLARDEEVPRLAQLSQKANQFNVCTNRYSEGDVARLLADSGRLLMSACARDRFGDYGLIALVHVAVAGDGTAEIVDWMMSCRAMNRRIEFSVEEAVERQLALRGVKRLKAAWRQTAKNAPVRELYDRFGFAMESASSGVRLYAKTVV